MEHSEAYPKMSSSIWSILLGKIFQESGARFLQHINYFVGMNIPGCLFFKEFSRHFFWIKKFFADSMPSSRIELPKKIIMALSIQPEERTTKISTGLNQNMLDIALY